MLPPQWRKYKNKNWFKCPHLDLFILTHTAQFFLLWQGANAGFVPWFKLHYISGGDGVSAIYEWMGDENSINKTMHYVLKDHLGSYETIITPGKAIEKLSFDPWGRRRNPVDWTYDNVPTNYTFSRGFTGHEHLDNFDLINMNGRVYDPWLGRFLSPDPIVQAPNYSQSYNRYSYVFNNPLKYTDPTG
ncbi:MAG: hypothetical protein C0591_03525, partial [Marinilabiliales bacterium]